MGEIGEKIKARLLVDETKIIEDALDACAPLIQLDPTGRVHLRDVEGLRGEDLIVLYLSGRRLASVAGLAETESASLDEVQDGTALNRKVAAARLNDLKKRSVVDSPERGVYRIVLAAVPAAIKAISKERGKHDE